MPGEKGVAACPWCDALLTVPHVVYDCPYLIHARAECRDRVTDLKAALLVDVRGRRDLAAWAERFGFGDVAIPGWESLLALGLYPAAFLGLAASRLLRIHDLRDL